MELTILQMEEMARVARERFAGPIEVEETPLDNGRTILLRGRGPRTNAKFEVIVSAAGGSFDTRFNQRRSIPAHEKRIA